MDLQLLLILIALLIITPLAIAGMSAAPWIPTRKKDVRRIIDLADIQPGQIVYDIGCGDARFLIEAAKIMDIKAIGIEISWVQVLHARIKIFFNRVSKKVKIKLKSLYREKLNNADLVFIFLLPKALPKIGEKLEKELKNRTKVITSAWPIPNWEKYLIKKDQPNKDKDIILYLYEMKK